jgi:hypothetical protein
MRVLCVCTGGNVRSVTLARLLRRRKVGEVLVCGVEKRLYADDTILMLFAWADVIHLQADSLRVLTERFARNPDLLAPYEYKFDTSYDVGPDDWQHPDHPDLIRIYRQMLGERHP